MGMGYVLHPASHQISPVEGGEAVLADQTDGLVGSIRVAVGVPQQPAVGAAGHEHHRVLPVGHRGSSRVQHRGEAVRADRDLA